jgi:hypothetical protein
MSTALTLYSVEENLAALLDTADMVEDPAQQEAIEREIVAAHMAAVEKRDRVHQFLVHCEMQAGGIDHEIKRLQALKKNFESARDRVTDYIVRVIKDRGPDEKGKYPKLEGKTCSFAIQRNPESVEITDPAAISERYQRITLSIPALHYETVRSLANSLGFRIHARGEVEIMKADIRKDLQDGSEVPGAMLITDKYSLRRR